MSFNDQVHVIALGFEFDRYLALFSKSMPAKVVFLIGKENPLHPVLDKNVKLIRKNLESRLKRVSEDLSTIVEEIEYYRFIPAYTRIIEILSRVINGNTDIIVNLVGPTKPVVLALGFAVSVIDLYLKRLIITHKHEWAKTVAINMYYVGAGGYFSKISDIEGEIQVIGVEPSFIEIIPPFSIRLPENPINKGILKHLYARGAVDDASRIRTTVDELATELRRENDELTLELASKDKDKTRRKMNNRLKALRAWGLIDMISKGRGGQVRFVYLTQKGVCIAVSLIELEKAVERVLAQEVSNGKATSDSN